MKKLICLLVLLLAGCTPTYQSAVLIKTELGSGSGVIIQVNEYDSNTSEILILTCKHILETTVKEYPETEGQIMKWLSEEPNKKTISMESYNGKMRYFRNKKFVSQYPIVLFFKNGNVQNYDIAKIGVVYKILETEDLALIVIRCDKGLLPEHKIKISKPVNTGEMVQTISCPAALPPISTEGKFQYYVDKTQKAYAFCNIEHGSSGGGVFHNGELLGIINAMPVAGLFPIQYLCNFTVIDENILNKLLN